MKERTKWVLACGGIAVIAGLIVFALLTQPREPEYQGCSLSFWVDREPTPYPPRAEDALREIGPRAIPFLTKKLQGRAPLTESIYARFWSSLPTVLRQHLPRPKRPLLERVSLAFCELGPAAVPALCEACTNRDRIVRPTLQMAINRIAFFESKLVPVAEIIKLLRHPDSEVRAEAARAISTMGASGASLLEEHARTLVPELTRLLEDSDPLAREEAAFALWRINADTNLVGVLVSELSRTTNAHLGGRILNHFIAMGPSAKPAIPAISNVLAHSAYLRSMSNVVIRIDPSVFE